MSSPDLLEQLSSLGRAYDEISPVTVDEATLARVRPLTEPRQRPGFGVRLGLSAAAVAALVVGGIALAGRDRQPERPAAATDDAADPAQVVTVASATTPSVPADRGELLASTEIPGKGLAEAHVRPDGTRCLRLTFNTVGMTETCSEATGSASGHLYMTASGPRFAGPVLLVGLSAEQGGTEITIDDGAPLRVEAKQIWWMEQPATARSLTITTDEDTFTVPLESAGVTTSAGSVPPRYPIPNGAVLSSTSSLDEGTVVRVFDAPDGGTCLDVAWAGTGGSLAGCGTAEDAASGRIWFGGGTHEDPDSVRLLGVVPTTGGFTVEINGVTVQPDEHGVWSAKVPASSGLRQFTVTGNGSTTVIELGDAGASVVGSTDSTTPLLASAAIP